MPTTALLDVKSLILDLHNFRTVPQKDEARAVHAMVSMSPDSFWALTESLLADGYHPTENIIVMKKSSKDLTVKEGNRRIAALKIILGHISRSQLSVPSSVEEKIKQLPKEWEDENGKVPCAVYVASEAEVVDKIITLTHGKGEKAGRSKWNPVAKARHNREVNAGSEPGLDLLEKYLSHGANLTKQQSEQWAGIYPLTILDEAIRKLAPRLKLASARELADHYPGTIADKPALENIIRDIGLDLISFESIRDDKTDYALKYGIPALPTSTGASSQSTSGGTSSGAGATGKTSSGSKQKAVALDDPRSVYQALKKFVPMGLNREKVVTLLAEAKSLQLHKHQHAFCFLLRSMFEISAKAYCKDHSNAGGPKCVKADGEDRSLVDVLRDITKHLTQNGADKQMKKALHGAMTELGKSEGILSVTSMNQLVHNPKFSIKESDICRLFHNIYPLLEAMNR
jgi:hypothetical protein